MSAKQRPFPNYRRRQLIAAWAEREGITLPPYGPRSGNSWWWASEHMRYDGMVDRQLIRDLQRWRIGHPALWPVVSFYVAQKTEERMAETRALPFLKETVGRPEQARRRLRRLVLDGRVEGLTVAELDALGEVGEAA